MATAAGKPKGVTFRVSDLSLNTLLAVAGAIIAGMAAWGMFSSRLTLIERELVSLQKAEAEHAVALDKLSAQVGRNTAHQQEDELLIDQLFQLSKKPSPVRRAAN